MGGGKWQGCRLEGCGGQGHRGPRGCVELGRQAEGCLVRCALLKPNSWTEPGRAAVRTDCWNTIAIFRLDVRL